MIDIEKLIGFSLPDDLPPPRQPAVKAAQAAMASKLRGAAGFLELMADQVEKWPFGDEHFDSLNAWAGRTLDEAGAALTIFRETRNCEGRG